MAKRTVQSRFWEKVDKVGLTGCWLWTASVKPNGYGQFGVTDGDVRYAHRLAYEFLVGPVPDGLELDHLCRVRHCVNPAHLEPVTRRENLRRGVSANRRKTHCPQGHSYNSVNTYLDKRGGRICRSCMRQRNREYYARKKNP